MGYNFSKWGALDPNLQSPEVQAYLSYLNSGINNVAQDDFASADPNLLAARAKYQGMDEGQLNRLFGETDPRYLEAVKNAASTPDPFDDIIAQHPELLGQINYRSREGTSPDWKQFQDPNAYWSAQGQTQGLLDDQQKQIGAAWNQYMSPGEQDRRAPQGFESGLKAWSPALIMAAAAMGGYGLSSMFGEGAGTSLLEGVGGAGGGSTALGGEGSMTGLEDLTSLEDLGGNMLENGGWTNTYMPEGLDTSILSADYSLPGMFDGMSLTDLLKNGGSNLLKAFTANGKGGQNTDKLLGILESLSTRNKGRDVANTAANRADVASEIRPEVRDALLKSLSRGGLTPEQQSLLGNLQKQATNSPYDPSIVAANSKLQSLVNDPSTNPNWNRGQYYADTLENYYKNPGSFTGNPAYQFSRDEALNAAQRAGAARGMNMSGNLLTELQNRASGLASQNWNQEVQNLNNLSTSNNNMYNSDVNNVLHATDQAAKLKANDVNTALQAMQGANSAQQAGSNYLGTLANAAYGGSSPSNAGTLYQTGNQYADKNNPLVSTGSLLANLWG